MKRKHYDILPEDFEGEDYTVWFWWCLKSFG